MNEMWLGDASGFDAAADHYSERGDSYSLSYEPAAPVERNPIGFMRRKPIVRIKAWTRPIPKGQP